MFLVSVFFLVNAYADCDFQPKSVQQIFNNPNLIEEQLLACQKGYLEDVSFEFNLVKEPFSDQEGEFVYYKKTKNDKVLFSEKNFKNAEGEFYYLRHAKDNENLIFSIKKHSAEGKSYTYHRKGRGDDNVIWSTNSFSEAESQYVYFRRQTGDEKTFLSIKILNEGTDKIIYFRTGRGDGSEICSIKNGVYRDANRSEISVRDFYETFISKFWNPLKEETVDKTLPIIKEGLDNYL